MRRFAVLFVVLVPMLALAGTSTLTLVSSSCADTGPNTATLTATWKNNTTGCTKTFTQDGYSCRDYRTVEADNYCKPIFCCCHKNITPQPTITVSTLEGNNCLGPQWLVWNVVGECD